MATPLVPPRDIRVRILSRRRTSTQAGDATGTGADLPRQACGLYGPDLCLDRPWETGRCRMRLRGTSGEYRQVPAFPRVPLTLIDAAGRSRRRHEMAA